MKEEQILIEATLCSQLTLRLFTIKKAFFENFTHKGYAHLYDEHHFDFKLPNDFEFSKADLIFEETLKISTLLNNGLLMNNGEIVIAYQVVKQTTILDNRAKFGHPNQTSTSDFEMITEKIFICGSLVNYDEIDELLTLFNSIYDNDANWETSLLQKEMELTLLKEGLSRDFENTAQQILKKAEHKDRPILKIGLGILLVLKNENNFEPFQKLLEKRSFA